MLAVPVLGTLLRCRVQRHPLDTTRVVAQLGIVADTGRWHEMVVVFDTMGNTEMLVVHHDSPQASGLLHNRGFEAHFSPTASGYWGAQDSRADPPRASEMTPGELARARALGEWAWAGPCRRGR